MNTSKSQDSSSVPIFQTETQDPSQYKEYPQRFVALAAYFLICATYSIGSTTFGPISAIVSNVYGIKPIWVNMNSLVFNFLPLPLSFPVGYLLGRFGLQISMRVSGVLAIIGAWMRTLINHNYYYSLAGSIVFGMGYPIIQNSITMVSLVWFRAERRELVTRFLLLSALVTLMVGNVISGEWMPNYDGDNDPGYSEGKNQIYSLMRMEAYVITGAALIGGLIFYNRPPSPPSFTATQERIEIGKSLQTLFKNKSYLQVMLCYSLFLGAYLAMGSTLAFVLAPFGYGPDIVSYSGVTLVAFGIIGNGVSSKLFRKNPRFKAFLLFGIIGTIAGYGSIILTLPLHNNFLIFIPFAVVGAITIQAFPIFLELSSETGYPVSEPLSSGFLQGFAQMMGFALGSIYSLYLNQVDKDPVYIEQISNISIQILCLVVLKFTKIKLNRRQLDDKNNIQNILNEEQNDKEKSLLSQDVSAVSSSSPTTFN